MRKGRMGYATARFGRLCQFRRKRTEPCYFGLAGPEPNRTEPNRTEPNRTEPNRTEPNRTLGMWEEKNRTAMRFATMKSSFVYS